MTEREKKGYKFRRIAMGVLTACIFCAGCGMPSGDDVSGDTFSGEGVTRELFAMDTYMSLTACGDNAGDALDKAACKINELDNMLSALNKDSEVSMLNDNGMCRLSEDVLEILNRSLEIADITDGAFNPAVYPLMELWGFTTGSYNVPKDGEIKRRLELMNIGDIVVQDNRVTMPYGMKLDFGGIVKGYASDAVMDIFRQCGVTEGIINLGGNVHALGSRPDKNAWKVAIRNPKGGDCTGVVEVTDKAVITSGGYERYFEENGVRYGHIIDTETGYPADNGVASVSIVSSDGTLADGLSTALYVMGVDKAVSFWREHSGEFDFVIVKDDGEILVSAGIKDMFSSDYDYGIVY